MGDFLPAVPALPPLPSLTEQDVLDLFDRLLPDHYLAPLKDPGPGYELLRAYAAVAARISEAVAHVGTGNFIASAEGGAYAEGRVEFYREAPLFGAVQLQPGTIVATDDGYTYETLDFVTLQGQPSAESRVRATVRGWLYNKPGPITCADGSIIPGAINRLVRPVLPAYNQPFAGNFDPTIKVRQITDVTGGAAPMLDGLGYDRGLPRFAGETDEAYRQRLIQLPATVTPSAVQEQIDTIVGEVLRGLGLRYWYFEGWDLRFQTGWNHPKNVVVYPGGMPPEAPVATGITYFSENVFAWDYDPVTMPASSGFPPSRNPLTNRLLDAAAYSSAILIGLPYIEDLASIYRALASSLHAIKPAGVQVYFIFTQP